MSEFFGDAMVLFYLFNIQFYIILNNNTILNITTLHIIIGAQRSDSTFIYITKYTS